MPGGVNAIVTAQGRNASAPSVSATSPAITPANTERRSNTIRHEPDRDRAEPHRRRHGREHARREDGELGDDAGEDRGRDRPHPHDDLGILVEPAREDDAEPAPHLVRQEADDDQRQIGGRFRPTARSSQRLAEAMHQIGGGAGRDAAPHQVEPDLPPREQRAEHEAEARAQAGRPACGCCARSTSGRRAA